MKYYGSILVTLILSLLLSTYCIFQTSNAVLKPLRVLNMRMNEILQDDNFDEVSLGQGGGCEEIAKLQAQFSDLISDYKFTQNEFIKQESDCIALIDLAQACVLFGGQNYKSAGVCYNNIANLHYKNGKYQLAADSYNKAVHMAYVCLQEITPEEFYKEFETEKPDNNDYKPVVKPKGVLRRHFETVKAHRYYQFSMCMYKIWRYQNGSDLLEQERQQIQQQNVNPYEEKQYMEKENEHSDSTLEKLIDMPPTSAKKTHVSSEY